MSMLVLDVVLILFILTFAVLATDPRKPFRAIILYMMFGFLVTLSWVRLDAWDVAIAEAAIGAGFTGILLFKAYHWVARYVR